MRIAATMMVAVLALNVALGSAQTPPKMTPTAPGTPGDPAWQGVVRLTDGRAFVTDGGLAIETAIAKPAALPSRELPGKVLQDYMGAAHKDEWRLSDLSRAMSGKSYSTPNGIALSTTYVDFLRRVLPATTARLRTTSAGQPVIVMISGKAVGVLMPMKQ